MDSSFEKIKYLRDIKSPYIQREIFLFLNQKQKLNMIIYNKQLQKEFKVNIEDYQKVSGKFKKIEANGIGREYFLNTNTLIFEGEYKNKKRNGKGKVFYNDKIIFDGEYSNGIVNGKGKEYYYNGKLKFDGEYFNEKIWNGKLYDYNGNIESEIKEGKGFIKEYGFYGNLKYEGNYSNGKRNGNGKDYHDNILNYEGEYLNGERSGKGKEYYKDGKLKFEGDYQFGRIWNGKGYDKNGNIEFEIKDGKGYIKEYDDSYGKLRLRFEGEYFNGKRYGKGKEYYFDGRLLFEGDFLNGKRHGKGKEYNDNKIEFKGEYSSGKRNGKGKEYYNSGNYCKS